MTMDLRKTFLLFLLLSLAGCATPPRQELKNAREAVARAYAERAPHYAAKDFRAASIALKDGENLVDRGEYELAVKALHYAEAYGREAAAKARTEKERIEQERLRHYEDLVRLEPPPSLPETEEELALIKPAPAVPPTPPPPAPAPPPIVKYTVDNGETLWTIAARRAIYRDALLWPLIYKANRDQIKDPRQIYPGQVLSIPRGVSASEKEEARETARHSDIFPLELLLGNTPQNSQ